MIDIVLCASGSEEVRIVHDLAMDRTRPARVVRRCADLTETLAVVAAGIGDVVLIDLAVRGLGRDAIASLLRDTAVVGLQPEGDEERTTLGLRHTVPTAAPTTEIIAALHAAVETEPDSAMAWVQDPAPEAVSPSGRMVTVWSPAGAPGRSTLAVNLAAESALAGTQCILVDADTHGPSLSQMLGVIEETPGLVAAGRAHDRDALTAQTLDSLLPLAQPNLRFLSGIGVPARWSELRTTSLQGVWQALHRRDELVIVDVASSLDEDEELSYDTAAPQRNAAAITALESADAVVAVVGADPVSITRLLRDHVRLTELGVEELHVIVNRVGAPVPGDRIRELIASRIPVSSLHLLPDDPVSCRTAAWDGALLAEAAPRSPLRRGVRDIAASDTLHGRSAAQPAPGRAGERMRG